MPSDTKSIRLHTKARRILFAVATAEGDGGLIPTYRELCGLCGLSSTSMVGHHVTTLIEAGLLFRPSGRPSARSLKLTDEGREFVGVTTGLDRLKAAVQRAVHEDYDLPSYLVEAAEVSA